MSEWVKGSEVDWEGWAEYFTGHDHFGERQAYIRKDDNGSYLFLRPERRTWERCDESHGIKFRRPVDPDGERWRRIVAKLPELKTVAGRSQFTVCCDGYIDIRNGVGESVFDAYSCTELDAYLSKPTKRQVTINGNTHSLLPGESVDCGEFTVTRKEKP